MQWQCHIVRYILYNNNNCWANQYYIPAVINELIIKKIIRCYKINVNSMSSCRRFRFWVFWNARNILKDMVLCCISYRSSLKSQTWANKRVVCIFGDAYISHLYDDGGDDEKFDLFIYTYEPRLNLIFEKLNFICKLQ